MSEVEDEKEEGIEAVEDGNDEDGLVADEADEDDEVGDEIGTKCDRLYRNELHQLFLNVKLEVNGNSKMNEKIMRPIETIG